MPKRDPRVTKYIRGRVPFARPILTSLRQTIHQAGPPLEERIKWGMPTFLYNGKIVCGFAGFRAHCSFWFWRGKDIVGAKSGEGMGNFGRITTVSELPSAAKVRTCIVKATKLIDQKQSVARRPRKRSVAAKVR